MGQASHLTGGVHSFPVVELSKEASGVLSKISGVAWSATVISGSEAFRKYDWLRRVPGLNKNDNLRGMVVSRKWRAVFEPVSRGAKVIGNVATVASFAAYLGEQYDRIDQIMNSSEDPALKALRLADISGTAAERTLAGMVTGVVSTVLLSMQGYCRIAGLTNQRAQEFSNECVKFLEETDGKVKTFARALTDRNDRGAEYRKNAVMWITTTIDFR